MDKNKAWKYLAMAQDSVGKGPKNETLQEHREHCKAEQGNCPFERKENQKDEETAGLTGNEHPTDVKTSKQLDADYADAVTRGDKETALKMIREAAAKAMPNTKVVDENGLPNELYRGTIEKENIPKHSIEAGTGIFLTDNEDVAAQFTFEREYGELITSRYNEETCEYEDIEGGPIESCFVNVLNPKIIGGRNAQIATDDSAVQSKEIENTFSEGYDCLILENVKESVDNPTLGTSYIIRTPSQIKSADITYDDNGNLIPLSQRFNFKNNDIRY